MANNADKYTTDKYISDKYTLERTTSGIDIAAGLWLILSPFILGFTNVSSASWNSIIVGILVALVSLISFAAIRSMSTRWLGIVLGAWLVVSPYILGFSYVDSALWNGIIVGAIILISSAWGATSVTSHNRMRTQ